jgi:hypothetical protein
LDFFGADEGAGAVGVIGVIGVVVVVESEGKAGEDDRSRLIGVSMREEAGRKGMISLDWCLVDMLVLA